MKEKELLYYFPYSIDKTNNFRHFANDNSGFLRQFIPNYDGTNRQEFIEEKTDLTKSEIIEIDYDYGNYSQWVNWYNNGKHIFDFSEELLLMLQKTDVSEITADMFHPPYDIFYLSLKSLNLKLSKDYNEIIEGVYVEHQIWDASGHTYNGYCELTLNFVGNFKQAYQDFADKVSSQLPYNINGVEKYTISPLGDFWKIWLMFDPKDGKPNVQSTIDVFLKDLQDEIFPLKNSNREVTDIELDFFNSATELIKNTIDLVINCILYLSQPTEKKDIQNDYPKGLPHNFNRKLSFAKTKKEKKKISEKIENLGFARISFVGQSFRRRNSILFENNTIEPHWRRGHWRKQRYGFELSKEKLIWILPTIVNHQKGEPTKGQIYEVE